MTSEAFDPVPATRRASERSTPLGFRLVRGHADYQAAITTWEGFASAGG
ncbi:MAG TPA: hypothetical protein VHN98_03050 [Acidimicrobiales bacterium]|nr:hypothetical protein [Acidimicrobiales bacterium]